MTTLLTHLQPPAVQFLSGFSPAANFLHGLDGLVPPEADSGGTVHVAVGKSVEKTTALLQWTFSTFPGHDVCLVHVHRPSPLIPTLLGRLPANQANPKMVAAFRNEERQEILKLLSTYLFTCTTSRVKARVISTEADEVQKGIVNLVNTHNVRKLVVRAIPDFIKGKKSSCKTSLVAKFAPSYCNMWFVDKGKLIWTRQASVLAQNDVIFHHRDEEASETEITLSPISQCDHSASSSSSDKMAEECSSVRLAELKREVDESNDEEYKTLLEQNHLEAEAMEAFNKVKALEMAHANELKQRIDVDDAIRTRMQEKESLLQEREKLTQQLQKTMRTIAVLDSRGYESNRRHEEVADELKLIQSSIATLRKEKQKLQRQKIEATGWLDRWRSRGLFEDVSELPEFLLPDLEAATCSFSENFRIGQGGYGIVYKGEMLDKTVAIKKFYSYNMQTQKEFDNAVKILSLSKLHHPHLVKLIGVCRDSLSLVYECLPGVSLQNLLTNNLSTLNWKIRSRIVADMASGLLALHSSTPQKIVHGNLKPDNLLLDSEYRCKISDYADHMLTSSQNLRCPSFRHCSGSTGSLLLHTDPESHRTGTLTYKSDIYSFGVVILELVTGKTHGGLVSEVRRALSNGKLASILDSSAGEWSSYVVRRLVELGLQCCELNGRDRPELTPSLVMEVEHMRFVEEETVPSFFLCPILREVMHDPQIAADGFSYEGDALRGWIEKGRETSPMTNLRLSHLNLTPNHSLRLAIQDWLVNLEVSEFS